MRKFIYEVNGTQYTQDTTPWGNGWTWAKAEAKATGSKIFRLVTEKDGSKHYEVFANGGCFIRTDWD